MIRVLFAMTLLMFSIVVSASSAVKDSSLLFQGESKTAVEKILTQEGLEYKDVEGIQDFTIVNSSGISLCNIYVSPSYSRNWEEDILGNRVMQSGQRMNVTMNGYGSHCDFDIKVVSCQGHNVERRLNLCQVRTYTIY